MSPLGRFLLNNCDNDMRISLDKHTTELAQFGGRYQIEFYARKIGLTLYGAKYTVVGMPAVRVPN